MGATGAAGATGATGATGSNGVTVGRFLATQIVFGATLTCASTALSATTTTCTTPKLNGLDIRFGLAELQTICRGVTGQTFRVASGAGVPGVTYFGWNGTQWVLSDSGSANPFVDIECNR
jgi:hypothetical protein